jgi:hypothetical protein
VSKLRGSVVATRGSDIGWRNQFAVLAQPLEMELDRLANCCLSLGDRGACRDAAREIRHVRREVGRARPISESRRC